MHVNVIPVHPLSRAMMMTTSQMPLVVIGMAGKDRSIDQHPQVVMAEQRHLWEKTTILKQLLIDRLCTQELGDR